MAFNDLPIPTRELTDLPEPRRHLRSKDALFGTSNIDARTSALRQMLADQAADPSLGIVLDATGGVVEIDRNLRVNYPNARIVIDNRAQLRVATGATIEGGYVSSQSGIRSSALLDLGPLAHGARIRVEGAALDANSGPNELGAINDERVTLSAIRATGSHLDPLRNVTIEGHVVGLGMHAVVSVANAVGLTVGDLTSTQGTTGTSGEGGGILGLTGVQQARIGRLYGVGLGEGVDFNHDCLHIVIVSLYGRDLVGEGELVDINNSGYITILEAHAVNCKKPLGAYNNTEHLETVAIDARDYGHIKIPNFLVEFTRNPSAALTASMVSMSAAYGRGSEIGLKMRIEAGDGEAALDPTLFDVPIVNIDCDRLDVDVLSEIVPASYDYLVRNNLAESVTRARIEAPFTDGMAGLEVAGQRAVAVQPRIINTSGTSAGRIGTRLDGSHSTVLGPREGTSGIPAQSRVVRRASPGFNAPLVPAQVFTAEPAAGVVGEGELYFIGAIPFVKPPGKEPQALGYAGGAGVVPLDVAGVGRSANLPQNVAKPGEIALQFNAAEDGSAAPSSLGINWVNRDAASGSEAYRAVGTQSLTLTVRVAFSSSSCGAAGDTRSVLLYRTRAGGTLLETPELLRQFDSTEYNVEAVFSGLVMQDQDEVEMRVALPASASTSHTILAASGAFRTSAEVSGVVYE